MLISYDDFVKAMPRVKNHSVWHGPLNEIMAKYQINTKRRIASFLAQIGHESGDLNRLSENLNYSPAGLRATFGRYYTQELANRHGRTANHPANQEAIANHVYDDRNPARTNKLGNIRDGDGWRFRGAGLIQLTGRANITQFADSIGMAPEEAADYARTPQGALESAAWFWKKNNLNSYADRNEITAQSKRINGGSHGLDDRINRYNAAYRAIGEIGVDAPQDTVTSPVVAKVGDRGETVVKIQVALGFTGRDVDGVFGNQTLQAVKSWQRINRLIDNGVVTQNDYNQLVG